MVDHDDTSVLRQINKTTMAAATMTPMLEEKEEEYADEVFNDKNDKFGVDGQRQHQPNNNNNSPMFTVLLCCQCFVFTTDA